MTFDLSIIVPLYNEEESIGPMYEAIQAAVQDLPGSVEIVFVDDGSRDRTFALAGALPRHSGNVHLRLVKFRRNFGQTAAMAAGIEHARGRILITMDGDLQNDPADIPLFLAKIDEGYDLVVGWRHDRQDHWSRVLPSKVANWLIGKATGVPIKDNGCSLKAYRAELIKEIPLYAEMHRFIPAMSSLAGARIAEIKVRHHARRFGQSKYGFSRIYKVFLDLLAISTILGFHRQPMLAFAGLAAIATGLGFVSLGSAIVYGMTPHDQPGIVFSGLAVLFGALAIFLMVLGLLSQLIYGTMARRFDPFRRLAARLIATEPEERPA
ncbi:MAG: glycosyltransferase family 2 protein [Geminicoccaceae bacterium]|jgi:glycosyltransferase involved in cell wall biosynthesis|nr:glycosyltransferase family 2 protein [Geminicoccaceae bacterium]HRX72890.1 glycosyltransferase family 2 protein [Hyphomonas sp.]